MRFLLLFLFLITTIQAEFIVIIDPGHGGSFIGCKGEYLLEKDVNLTIALKLDTVLQKNNITSILTRSIDSSLDTDLLTDLKKRVALTSHFEKQF